MVDEAVKTKTFEIIKLKMNQDEDAIVGITKTLEALA